MSATYLDDAQRNAVAVAQLEAMGLDDAYAIQAALIDLRVLRGERIVGAKLGFTSEAKMAQMGVREVIAGRLTDAMRIEDGATVDLARFIHPRIEPEIAFRVAVDLPADGDATTFVDAVAPALEIIDSRYRDFRFSLPDVVADNASSAAFVIGAWQPVGDVRDRAVTLRFDGETVETGSTSDILGDPFKALVAYVQVARTRGLTLRRGDVLLAGAATAAVALRAAAVTAEIDGLGSVGVRGIDG